MNESLKQYVDLYRENIAVIDGHSAPVLNALRPEAAATLERIGSLPTRRSPRFEKTSIDEMFAPDFGVNVARLDIPRGVASGFRCDVPRVSTLLAYVVNDAFVPSEGLDARLPEGVMVMSLAKAAREYPELVATHYGHVAPTNDAPVALNTMLAQDGVFIHVGASVVVERPIQIISLLTAGMPLAAFRRMLVVMEPGAKASILTCAHTPEPQHHYLASEVVELSLGRGAELDFCAMEESSAKTSLHWQMYATQAADSHLRLSGMTLSNGRTRNDYSVGHSGTGCSTLISGMAIGRGHQHIDNATCVTHSTPHCQSRQLFKYILDDEATGAFEGDITVNTGAVGTSAYQSNKNLLASVAAKMHSKPQLLIYCDDVKCSHGASTGQLDPQALFYMRARGIDEKIARSMLMQAFMSEVIDTIAIEGMRERLRHLVDRHLHGEATYCADCQIAESYDITPGHEDA